ncbi:MAG: hypothetical protein KatS3mg105_1864 [Gemmatales bacterium]|nr:MAG: hypothetical protein KatS3mg105_1864 [Gemmatales bacterium]
MKRKSRCLVRRGIVAEIVSYFAQLLATANRRCFFIGEGREAGSEEGDAVS